MPCVRISVQRAGTLMICKSVCGNVMSVPCAQRTPRLPFEAKVTIGRCHMDRGVASTGRIHKSDRPGGRRGVCEE